MKLSVIVPMYNRVHLIGETLESILAQTKPVHEIIVVDDGSTDGSHDVVANAYPTRVTLLLQGENRGVQAARNRGFAVSTGDWVVFCDSDDLWMPDFVERLEAAVNEVPELDMVVYNFRTFDETGPAAKTKFDSAPPGWWERAQRIRGKMVDQVDTDRFVEGTFDWHPVFTSSTAILRKSVDAVDGFDESLRGKSAEDGEFYLRCLYGSKIGIVESPLVKIRRHSGNFSINKLKNIVDEIWMLQYILQTHPQSKKYDNAIKRQIRERRLAAVNLAFDNADHKEFRKQFKELRRADYGMKLFLKCVIANIPDAVGVNLNKLYQSFAQVK